MGKRFGLAVAVTLVVGCAAHASSVELTEYLHARNQHRISATAPLKALEIAVGVRVIEVSGVIKGYSSGESNGSTVVLESEPKRLLFIHADAMGDWMKIGHVPARMLVRVTRADEVQPASYDMIAAVPEELMARWEQEQPKPKPKPTPRVASRRPAPSGPQGTIDASPPPKLRPGAWTASRSFSGWTDAMTGAFPYYAAEIARRNPRLAAQEVEKIAASVIQFSVQCGVDARLIMAMVVAESGFNPRATSRSGAMGLGQLMPGTARGMGVVNAYDPEENLAAAVKIIGGHMSKYGGSPDCLSWEQIQLTMAAYNAGAGAVKKYGGVPPYRETQNYVKRVIALYKSYSGYK